MKLAWDSGPIYTVTIVTQYMHVVHGTSNALNVFVCAWISILIGLQGMNSFRVVWRYTILCTRMMTLSSSLFHSTLVLPLCVVCVSLCMCARASVWVFSASEFFFIFLFAVASVFFCLSWPCLPISFDYLSLSLGVDWLQRMLLCYNFITTWTEESWKNRCRRQIKIFIFNWISRRGYLIKIAFDMKIDFDCTRMSSCETNVFGSSPADRERNSWNENKNIHWNDIVASGRRRRGCEMETGRRIGGPGLCWWWSSCCFLASTMIGDKGTKRFMHMKMMEGNFSHKFSVFSSFEFIHFRQQQQPPPQRWKRFFFRFTIHVVCECVWPVAARDTSHTFAYLFQRFGPHTQSFFTFFHFSLWPFSPLRFAADSFRLFPFVAFKIAYYYHHYTRSLASSIRIYMR